MPACTILTSGVFSRVTCAPRQSRHTCLRHLSHEQCIMVCMADHAHLSKAWKFIYSLRDGSLDVLRACRGGVPVQHSFHHPHLHHNTISGSPPPQRPLSISIRTHVLMRSKVCTVPAPETKIPPATVASHPVHSLLQCSAAIHYHADAESHRSSAGDVVCKREDAVEDAVSPGEVCIS